MQDSIDQEQKSLAQKLKDIAQKFSDERKARLDGGKPEKAAKIMVINQYQTRNLNF